MKRILVLAGLAVILFSTSIVHAQESLESQLDFVRKLRAKGYLDLAMERLEELRKNPDPTLQALVPLESARISIAMARMREPDQRPALFLAARKELQGFVDKNPGRPEAGQARLEIARLATFQGETLLTKAIREDDAKARAEQAKKAEAQFILAGQELEVAAKLLTDMAANYKNPDAETEKKVREQLQQEAYQARFDRAANMISRARTYLDDGKTETFRQRGELMKEAIKSLESVLEGETPLAVKRLAEAWLIKANQEIQDPTASRKYYNRVINDETPAAQPAQRMAKLFNIQGIMMHLDPKSQYKDPELEKVKPPSKLILDVDKEAKAWLKAYPNYAQTPEGMAIQFNLANAYYHQAVAAMKPGDPKKKTEPTLTPAATKLFNQALKYYAVVADSDSEYAEQAGGVMMKLSVDRIKDLELHQIVSFDDCFLKARYEMFLLKNADQGDTKEPDPKADKKFKERLRVVIAALQRAQILADAKTSPAKLDDVRYLLMSAYLTMGDLYRAAVAAEALGRTRPPTKRAPLGAAYGIEAYAAIYNKDKDEGNRQRLQKLTDYVLSPENQKVWATDPVTSTARYQLALLCEKDENFKAALDHLEKLPPDFNGYVYATGNAVFIALEAKGKAKDPQEIAFFEDQARKALARLPQLPDDADASTAAMYFRAKLRMPYILYADADQELKKNELVKALQKYKDMLNFLDQTAASLGKLKVKLSEETGTQLNFSIDVLRKYARLGQSDIDYRAGRYKNVVDQTEDVAKVVKDKAGAGSEPIQLKDHEITSQLLGLRLRAKVQLGKIAEAKEILHWMDRLKGEGVTSGDNTLLVLIQELRTQVEDLKKYKDDAKLKETITNFTSFADELAAKPKLETRDYIFLANFYNSLQQHSKAADLYKKIPPPKALEDFKNKDLPKEPKDREPIEKDLANYWYLQIEYAKALRLSKLAKNPNDPNLKLANKTLDTLVKHRHGRFLIPARMEQIFILMDADLYGTATKKWAEFMKDKNLVDALPNDPKLKRLYFEAYYHNTFCWYRYSQSEPVVKAGKEQQFVDTAARYVVRLEPKTQGGGASNPEGWDLVGDMFQRLLDAEPKLKEAYEKQKKAKQ